MSSREPRVGNSWKIPGISGQILESCLVFWNPAGIIPRILDSIAESWTSRNSAADCGIVQQVGVSPILLYIPESAGQIGNSRNSAKDWEFPNPWTIPEYSNLGWISRNSRNWQISGNPEIWQIREIIEKSNLQEETLLERLARLGKTTWLLGPLAP